MLRRQLFMYAPDEPVAPAPADTAPNPVEGETPTQEEVNWQKRAEDAQAWGTRTSQEAAELREWRQQLETDPDALRDFLRAQGYDVEDDTPEPPQDLDELRAQLLAELRQEIEPVKQTQAEIAQEKELAQVETHASTVFSKIGEGRGWDLDENEQEAIIGRALTMPPDDKGMPPFQAAYDALEKVWEAREARSAQKRRPTHKFTPGGVAGDEKPDTSTSEGRTALILSRLQDTA